MKKKLLKLAEKMKKKGWYLKELQKELDLPPWTYARIINDIEIDRKKTVELEEKIEKLLKE